MKSPLELMLQQAVQAFQDRNFMSAEVTLSNVLRAYPKSLPALQILGLIKAMQAKHAEAAELLKKAVRISPNNPSLQYNLAKALMESGAGTEALPYHKRATELMPSNAEAWLNYGKSLSYLDRHQEAIAIYERALNINEGYAEAYLNRGASFKALKRYVEANLSADKALEINPSLFEAWSNKGIALKELKRYDEALASYEKALSIHPQYHEAWSNKGVTLSELKRYDEALASYEKALSIHPQYHEAWNNLGVTYKELKRYDEALASYEKALSIHPQHHEAWYNKGIIFTELKRYDEGLASFSKAASLKADQDYFLGVLTDIKMLMANWQDLDKDIDLITEKIKLGEKAITPFALLAISNSSALHLEAAQIWTKDKFPVNMALPILGKNTHEKIRIGYFSADFQRHPVAFLTAELFEVHDRERFEIYGFSLRSASPGDDMVARLTDAFDGFFDVENKSDEDIAQLAREMEIDIAIDLGGHTRWARTGVFSCRAAPIQVNYLGYPGTMGADYMDYIIADRTLIPESSQVDYLEKVAYLPNSYMVDDSKRQVSKKIFTRGEFNLPENQFIYCCLNNSYKFNKKLLASWAKILLEVNDSVLWLSENNEPFMRNVLQEFSKLNIDKERIIFAGKLDLMSEHLARLSLADLFLDTLPFNAHTTAVDALKGGLPVLTLLGETFAGRVAGSVLNAIDLPELITHSQEEYESLAIELGTNPALLKKIKEKLITNQATTPLFNTPLFTRHIEAAYSKMYQRYQLDQAPDHIYID